MKQKAPLIILSLLTHLYGWALHRNWTASDGLHTNEVHQIVELPNGQVLVNCEGAFCLSDGKAFRPVFCDRNRSYRLGHYVLGYGHWWQGDSLLWLHDFYRLYLFDARSRTFRYDIGGRLTQAAVDKAVQQHTHQDLRNDAPRAAHLLDSIANGHILTACMADRQGGYWLGTRESGIFYILPYRRRARNLFRNDTLLRRVRNATDSRGRIWECTPHGLTCIDGAQATRYDTGNVQGLAGNAFYFCTELDSTRYLVCNQMNRLGYLYPAQRRFVALNGRLPRLDGYRYMAGACVLPQPHRVAVYTQNGIFILDTQADSLMPYPYAAQIERYSDKYNCMLVDGQGRHWTGTQDGLFCNGERIEGLSNNCIRSLVEDAYGDIWAGTSCGISRVTPNVANLGESDGIPPMSMLERSACLLDGGEVAFAYGASIILFRPEWLTPKGTPPTVSLTGISVNGHPVAGGLDRQALELDYRQNYLGLEFSAFDYATPERTHYRYRLTGLDKEWQYSTDNTGCCTARYHALTPGHYRFEAQASLDGERWGPSLRLGVDIAPPFWLTWWAQTLYVVLSAGIVVALILLYLRHKKRQLERENESRVNRLFELRDAARHQFAENIHIDANKLAANIEEEEFMKQLLQAIEAHMGNEDYNVDQLAADVAMGRASLYRRLRNMLGITPSDFIRNVRLKHAAHLLSDTDLPIANIASKVGFCTPRNFSTTFKKVFGVLPNEYRGGKKEGTDSSTGAAPAP